MAPLTETGIEVVFTPTSVDDDIRREGVLCMVEVRVTRYIFRLSPFTEVTVVLSGVGWLFFFSVFFGCFLEQQKTRAPVNLARL